MNVQQQRRAATESRLPQVFGRYLLIQRLSRGGMGEIFLARHGLSGFEKLVVIKKVLPHLVQDEQFISRFVDEAQVAIKLQHANVAQVIEVGRVDDEYFLSLEYVEGRDVRRTLTALDRVGENWPVDLALYIGRDLASGLAYAHRRTDDSGKSLRLVHCDISPPNLMVSFEGEVKIIDFGIAKSIMRGTASDPKIGFGKFGYMAPEQLIRGGEVDHRTDIYAAGVVLHELLTGERLYEMGESPDYRALARMVVKGQHPLPSDCDPELAPYDSLVAKALKPKPEDRYQTSAEFRDAIQHALVRLNPTVSSDNLGAFMRRLFATEVIEQRQLAARAKAANIEQFVAELTTQSATTVSFALAHMPLQAPPTEIVDRVPVHTPMPFAVVPRKSKKTGVIVAIVLAALLVAGTVLAFVLDDDQETTTADKQAAPVAQLTEEAKTHTPDQPAATVTAQAIPVPTVKAIPPKLDHGNAAVAAKRDDAVIDDAVIPAATKKQATPHHVAKRRTKVRVRRTPKKQRVRPTARLSPKQVQAKFRAVSREYNTFKSKHGSQLERSWSNLVYALQFANSASGLQRLDSKINRFRNKMRSKRN